jgi:hypothetical protein
MTGKNKAAIWILFLFFLPAVILGNGEKTRNKLIQLNRDITLLNLVNGMYLSAEQMESLIGKIEEAEKIRENFLREIENRDNHFEDVLQDVRDVLLQGDEIPEELKRRVHQMKEMQHRLEDERGEKLLHIQASINDLLTPNQLLVIEEYKPCTIPPEQGKIGQSAEVAVENITRKLSKIREMPSSQYDMLKDMFVDMHFDRIERHEGIMDEQIRELERQRILGIFEKTRSLSDQEFMVQKADLASQFLPTDSRKHQLRKNQLDKVGRFMLDPSLIPILKERLKG